MKATSFGLALLSLAGSAIAAPAPVEKIEDRGLISGLLGTVIGDINAAAKAGNSSALVSAYKSCSQTATPTAVPQAMSTLSAIAAASPSSIHDFNAALIANGLVVDSVDSILTGVLGALVGENSDLNINLRNPSKAVFPKKGATDAPYSLTEAQLRAAIYIPPGFTYGKKPPVILFPGTGATGYTTFIGNFIPLLQGSSFADPVWVNVPKLLLGDAQVNAEYAAYAINYIAGVTGKNVTITAWSQGNIDTQWALKYWPSTRKVVSDHIAISPDYKGTILADFICPALDLLICTPSVLQQRYLDSSNFITTLRANGGDSAYVPTTTIYSGFFDEIVEPQQGDQASAFLLDTRNVGVTNNEVQEVCPGGLAGSFYTHEGVLYNPIAFALFKDAMTHAGPGQVSRINTAAICGQYLTTGLDLGDLLLTENSILIAGLGLVTYEPKPTGEPPIMAYATL